MSLYVQQPGGASWSAPVAASRVWVGSGGVYRQVLQAWIGDAGVWKPFYNGTGSSIPVPTGAIFVDTGVYPKTGQITVSNRPTGYRLRGLCQVFETSPIGTLTYTEAIDVLANSRTITLYGDFANFVLFTIYFYNPATGESGPSIDISQSY